MCTNKQYGLYVLIRGKSLEEAEEMKDIIPIDPIGLFDSVCNMFSTCSVVDVASISVSSLFSRDIIVVIESSSLMYLYIPSSTS